MKKTFITTFIVIFVFSLFCSSTHIKAVEASNQIVNVSSPTALLMEASTGKIIYSKEENKRMYPASMTKMMSMYLLLECIDKKTHSFSDVVTISSFAASMGGSQIFLKENEKMTFEDLFTAIAVASANDAVVALAEYTYGSVELFVDAMNEKAQKFKMDNTHFVNTTGFHDVNHYTTTHDMGMLAYNLLKSYKHILLKYTSIYETYLRKDTSNPFWLVTTNKLLKNYEGMDGLKTGYTSESGYNLTATAYRNNLRFISVIMGSDSSKSRNADTTTLLNYGFNHYKTITVFKENETIKDVTFTNAKNKNVELICNEDINVLVKKNETLKNIKINIELYDTSAPKSKNEIIGKLTISNQNNSLLAQYDLYTRDDVKQLSFFDILFNYLKILF